MGKPRFQNRYCMNSFHLKCLFKILLVLLSIDLFGKKDTSLNGLDSAGSRPVKIAANPRLKQTGFRKFLIGSNYRNEWIRPVDVPVLNLGTAYGGLTPTKQGGGKQTKSLRVEDHSGKEWALRSVEKFPEKAVPAILRHTVSEKIVADGISASYPYGVLSM